MRDDSSLNLAEIRAFGLPQDFCFENVTQLISAISQYFKAVIPNDITNVIVSQSQPTSTQRMNMWVRLSASGTFIGIYFFNGTTWVQVLPIPNGVFWMHGDSTDVPEGFQLVDTGNPNFTAPEITHIKSFYYPAGPGPYTYFAVTFAGF